MNTAYKIAPVNIIEDFPDFESWAAGTSVAPDGWIADGTAGSIARESSIIKFGNYSMKIISGASANYRAEYNVQRYDLYSGKTLTFGAWVYCSSASKARLAIFDGITTTYSSYHTGSGAWEFLTVTAQIDSGNTQLRFRCEVTSATITAYFDGAYAVIGESIFKDLRSTNYYIPTEDIGTNVSFDVAEYEIPRRDGTVIENVVIRSKKIRIKTQIYDNTYTAARSVFDSLMYAFSNGKKQLYQTDDRFSQVCMTSFSSLKYKVEGRVYEFSVDFIAAEPYERFLCRLRNKTNVASSPTTFNFAYNGSMESLPKISFIPVGATMSTCLLENLTTGERLSFDSSVAVGNTLTIDCDERTVENNGVDGLSYFTGDFMKLVKGTNYLKFTGGSCSLYFDYHEKYL